MSTHPGPHPHCNPPSAAFRSDAGPCGCHAPPHMSLPCTPPAHRCSLRIGGALCPGLQAALARPSLLAPPGLSHTRAPRGLAVSTYLGAQPICNPHTAALVAMQCTTAAMQPHVPVLEDLHTPHLGRPALGLRSHRARRPARRVAAPNRRWSQDLPAATLCQPPGGCAQGQPRATPRPGCQGG